MADLYQIFFLLVVCGHGSLFVCRCCDTLCTSSFVDDTIICYHNDPMAGIEYNKHNSRDSIQI